MKAANLKPSLHLTFDGQIFNLLFDDTTEVLVLEIRNNAKYNASYAAFDLKKNKFINKNIQPLERWWTHMLAVKNGLLILYQYHDQQNPDLKDIFALDIKKGKQQWLHSHLQLTNVGEEKLQVIKTEGERISYWQIDLNSGKLFAEEEENPIAEKDNNNIHQPFHYLENSDYFATVKEFLKNKLSIEPVHAIDYLEFEDYILISYYEKKAGTDELRNIVLVLDDKGHPILQEIISDNLKAIGRDTYIILNRQLIMIQDKSTLKGYKL